MEKQKDILEELYRELYNRQIIQPVQAISNLREVKGIEFTLDGIHGDGFSVDIKGGKGLTDEFEILIKDDDGVYRNSIRIKILSHGHGERGGKIQEIDKDPKEVLDVIKERDIRFEKVDDIPQWLPQIIRALSISPARLLNENAFKYGTIAINKKTGVVGYFTPWDDVLRTNIYLKLFDIPEELQKDYKSVDYADTLKKTNEYGMWFALVEDVPGFKEWLMVKHPHLTKLKPFDSSIHRIALDLPEELQKEVWEYYRVAVLYQDLSAELEVMADELENLFRNEKNRQKKRQTRQHIDQGLEMSR